MTLGWGWSAGLREERVKVGLGKERVTLVDAAVLGPSSPLPHAPTPAPGVRGRGRRQGGPRGGRGGEVQPGLGRGGSGGLSGRQQPQDRGERWWPGGLLGRTGLPYLLRGPPAAPRRLGGALSPEGLWQAPAASE